MKTMLRDVIRKYLPEENLKPDFVCLTGDIAHSGKKQEYGRAGAFLKELAEALDLDPADRFFIVPGNHDVDRNEVDDISEDMREKITEANAPGLLAKSKYWRTFAERQEEFLAFTADFLGADRAWSAERPWRTEINERHLSH